MLQTAGTAMKYRAASGKAISISRKGEYSSVATSASLYMNRNNHGPVFSVWSHARTSADRSLDRVKSYTSVDWNWHPFVKARLVCARRSPGLQGSARYWKTRCSISPFIIREKWTVLHTLREIIRRSFVTVQWQCIHRCVGVVRRSKRSITLSRMRNRQKWLTDDRVIFDDFNGVCVTNVYGYSGVRVLAIRLFNRAGAAS